MEAAHERHLRFLEKQAARERADLKRELESGDINDLRRTQCQHELEKLTEHDPANEYMIDFAQFLSAGAGETGTLTDTTDDVATDVDVPDAVVLGLPANEQKRLGIKRKRRMRERTDLANQSIDKFVCKRRIGNKGEVFRQHQAMIQGYRSTERNYKFDFCPYCPEQPPLIHIESEGAHVCPECGVSCDVISNDARYIPFGTIISPITQSSYKRLNHLNEWITRVEARQRTFIPPEIIAAVSRELKKYRQQPEQLTVKMVRSYLEKLKLSAYYEHRVYIWCAINGKSPPHIKLSDKGRIRYVFVLIQEPYELCPSSINVRENFMGYSYTLNRICELLSLDSLMVYFPLPKSHEVLRQYENIWKFICTYHGWDFIPCKIK